MSRDLWSDGRYYDLDEAYSHAQDCFEEDLRAIWADATPAERRAIAHERHAADIRDKARRDFTNTEYVIYSRLAHADWLATMRDEPDSSETPF